MQNDQLNGLLALKAVAEKKSFTSAATYLGITPSAISQTIKQLETRVGVALLSRTTRSTSLTEAGEKFLRQAGPALDQILNAFDDVGDYAQRPSGLLRINLPRLDFNSFLAPIIKSFSEAYPDITLELYFEDGRVDVVEQGFDAGIRLSDILLKDMVAVKLMGPVHFVTAAAPSYLEKHGRPKHPKDLLSHCCIPIRLGSRIYDHWEFEQKGQEFEVKVKGPLILNDSLIVKQAGAQGLGIIYCAEDAIKDYVKEGKLEIILDKYKCSSTGYYLYYPQRSQVLPKLRVFIDHIKKHVSQGPIRNNT